MLSVILSRLFAVGTTMAQSARPRLLAVTAGAGLALAACASTPAPPPPQPLPTPVEEPVVEPDPEPQTPEEPVETGLIPPHMEGRDLARVAVLLPFSAESAAARAEALRLLRAAELALFERGGGNLLMIPKDTQGTPEGARSAALAAAEDGADLIIGPAMASI